MLGGMILGWWPFALRGPMPVPPKKAGAKLQPHGGKAPPPPPGDGSSEEDEEEIIVLDPPPREHGT